MPKITQLPDDQRPREKLVTQGAHTLSDSELIAIFLRTGIQGASAIEIGKRLLVKHGSLGNLGKLDAKQLSDEKGLGIAKASQLLACFELGARVAKEELAKHPLTEPSQIAQFLQPIIGGRNTEALLVLLVDSKLRLLRYHEISTGDVNSTTAHPREILRPAILHQATGFILAHNHPSGNPKPSRADDELTARIMKASDLMSIKFHDHIIVGQPSSDHASYYSYHHSGKLNKL